jgi:hypothetical protein
VKAMVINPIAQDSPSKHSEKAEEAVTSDFHPFGETLSANGSPVKPTIFDKLDNKMIKNEIAQKMEKMEAANVA